MCYNFSRMFRKIAIVLASLIFGSFILVTSILRTTTAQDTVNDQKVLGAIDRQTIRVDYNLPYPGILPDHFLWPLKALRDRIWLFLTLSPQKRAELKLLFADKRIGMAKELVKVGKPKLGVVTAQKAEQYLQGALSEAEKADERGINVTEVMSRIAKASLKHRELLEDMRGVTDNMQGALVSAIKISELVYSSAGQKLIEKGLPVPTPQLNKESTEKEFNPQDSNVNKE